MEANVQIMDLKVFFTLTQTTISCESCLTAAIKMSSGIYTSCILMAVMASDAAFIDI